jgi:hypothetical protein
METMDKVNDMKPIRLHPNKAPFLAVAIAFLAIAMGIVVVCILFEKYVFLVAAGLCFVFSGLFFSIMRRNVVFLDLSPAALEERFPGNNRRWKWNDFDSFFVVDVPIQSENGGTTECVGFLYSSSYHGAKEPSKHFASPHCDDTLRFLYGMKANELADLLNQWRSCKNTG